MRDRLRTALAALALIALVNECIAQFVIHDQRWVIVWAVVGIGAMTAWMLLKRGADECPPDCPKCQESASLADPSEDEKAIAPLVPYREVWDAELPPGGYVCNICGQPVESEPCPEHAPTNNDAPETPTIPDGETR